MNRPYRFGVIFGVINVLAGLCYGWLAITNGSVRFAAVLALSGLLPIAAGVGLLLKMRIGLLIMSLGCSADDRNDCTLVHAV